MSGKIENFHHPRRTNKPRDRVGSTEWLVVYQRTTTGAIIVETTPRAAAPPPHAPTSECTWSPASVLKYYVTRAPTETISRVPGARAEARPWRRSSRWWRCSARVTIKHWKTCFGALFSTELSQYHYLAHETTLIWCRILRATQGYNFDAMTLNISKVMT